MIKKRFLFPLFFIVACAGSDPADTSGGETDGSNETDAASPMIQVNDLVTKENAPDVMSYTNTPESVVQFFYASRIRGDKEWEKVCQAEGDRSDRMNRKLEDYNEWTILEYKFVSKQEKNEEKCFIKLWMKISVDGETDEGEDEAEVELIGGKWVITSIPT